VSSTLPTKGKHVGDVLSDRRPILEAMFAPKSVALIGASESQGSVGRALMENLKEFRCRIFPVNPKHTTILGQKAFPTISAVPEDVDLAVIATPAAIVPKIVAECTAAGLKGVVIISAGFKECGPAGAELEKQILERRGQMRIIGPNCVGVMLPHIGLNATFARPLALPGNIGFISQSGALCTAILDWSMSIQLGFSAFISIGSMADVNWGDLIYYLGDAAGKRHDDPNTFSWCRRCAANVVAIAGCKLSRRSRPRISRETISQVSDSVRYLGF